MIQNISFKSTNNIDTAQKRAEVEPQKRSFVRKKAVKAAAVTGSALASAGYLALLSKRQFKGPLQLKNLFKVDFSSAIKAIGLATSATAGGLAGGMIADTKDTRKAKLKEGIHQFLGNIITPISIVGIATHLIEKRNLPRTKELLYTGLAAIGGVGIGVTAGNKVASKVNEAIFKEDDTRKVKAKDFGIHVDDIMTWLALTAKTDMVKNFISKALPVVFLICGYEAGTCDGHDKKHH